MADNSLLLALQNAQTQAGDTPWGAGFGIVGSALPKLINPYGKVGTNIGIALGGSLLAGLLGYQAKKQAMEENMALRPLVRELMSAQTPEAADAILAKPGGSRLSEFAAELEMQRIQQAAARAQAEEEFKQKAMLAGINAGYVRPSSFDEMMTGKVSGLSLSPSSTLEAKPSTTVELPETEANKSTSGSPVEGLYEEARKIVGQAPSVDKLTEDDFNLPKIVLDRKKALIDNQQKERDDYDEKFNQTVTSLKQNYDDVRQFRTDLNNSQTAKDYKLVKRYNEAFKKLAANPTRANIDSAIALSKKSIDPTSVVTLGEYRQAEDVQSSIAKYQQAIQNIYSTTPRIREDAVKQMKDALGAITDTLGEAYNGEVNSTIQSAKELRMGNVTPGMLGASIHRGASQIENELDQVNAMIGSDKAKNNPAFMQKALQKKEELRQEWQRSKN